MMSRRRARGSGSAEAASWRAVAGIVCLGVRPWNPYWTGVRSKSGAMPLSLPWVWRAAREVLPMPSAARAASEDPDGLRQDLVADAPVQAAAGVEIGRSPQPLGKVVFDAHQIDDAEAGIGLKIDEEVDVAATPLGAAR